MNLILALHLIFGSYVFADIALPYHAETDALCFRNADPELAKVGIPILGSMGVRQGICQGIAGVTAAFLENADFESTKDSPNSEGEVHQLLVRLIQDHRLGTKEKITIGGSKNLKEFCEKNKREFMREAILYNAEIAKNKILPILPQLYSMKKNNLRGKADQEQLSAELQSIEQTLQSGHYPLMLYYKHVVMVVSSQAMFSDSGEQLLTFSTYDSNHPETTVAHSFLINSDGLPSLSNHLVWNLSKFN